MKTFIKELACGKRRISYEFITTVWMIILVILIAMYLSVYNII